MSNQNFENNGVNGTRPLGEGSLPDRCFLVQQQEPGHHQVTARMKWNKEVNKAVMECFYRSKPFDEEGKPCYFCITRLPVTFGSNMYKRSD